MTRWGWCVVLMLGCSEAPSLQALGVEAPPPGADAGGRVPPEPPLTLAVDVDVSESRLLDWDLAIVLGEINAIWAQAGICFEFRDARDSGTAALRLSFVGGDMAGLNGRYDGDRQIWSLDAPSLYDAPHPTAHPASRTASHELGHALGLQHYNGRRLSMDSLMASGTRGFFLHDFEIEAARRSAAEKPLMRACPSQAAGVGRP